MIGIITGQESFLYKRLYSWIIQFQQNYLTYQQQSEEKHLWLTRVLYLIDILVQHQLELLQDTSIPLHQVSFLPITQGFANRQEEILDNCLHTTLPENIINNRSSHLKKRKGENKNEYNNNNKKEYSGNNKERTDKKPYRNDSPSTSNDSSNSTQNPNINPKWKIPNFKQFKEYFIDTHLIQETPQHSNKPFCLQYHTKGVCHRGSRCNLSHEDPRNVKMKQKFSSFIQKAYKNSNNKSKQSSSNSINSDSSK
jgi:hypothetical protein